MILKVLGEQEDNLTGSMTLIEFPDKTQGLIDFGLTQFNDGSIASSMIYNGRDFDFNVNDIDFVVITHAHADHLGLLPLLVKRGFKGKIITTLPTSDFASLTLYDTVKIFESDCEWYNKVNNNKIEPIFDKEDVGHTLGMMRSYDFNTEIFINDEVTVTLKKAGHMLGACMPLFKFYDNKRNQKTIMFTGDTSGLANQKPFLPPADDLGEVNYLVTESTYGNRVREKVDVEKEIIKSINRTCITNNATLLIPVFSLQRSSELLWTLREIYNNNPQFKDIPIILDSPLAVSSQNVVDKNREYWGDTWISRDKELGNLFSWGRVEYVTDFARSMTLGNGNAKILLSSSGMCDGGRILRHLKTFMPYSKNEILFTGYQVNGTIGHGIVNSKKDTFGMNGERISLKAKVSSIPFSGHADMNQLTSLIQTTKKGELKKVFIIHGDDESKTYFRKHLIKNIKGAKVIVPRKNKEYKILK